MTVPQMLRNACSVRGAEVRLTPGMMPILLCILLRKGCVVHIDELVEAAYPDPDAAPDWDKVTTWVQMHRLRKLVPGILSLRGRGYMIEKDSLA